MLQFRDIYFKYDDQPLFCGLTFAVHAGHRACIIGRNGVGKTTLFKLLLGELIPDDGEVSYPKEWRVATLRQHVAPSARTALDFVMDGDVALRTLEQKISSVRTVDDDRELIELLSAYEDQGGYQYAQRAETILQGLGFGSADREKPHREFSGGWRIRLNLAQALMVPSDFLLLDEPTNHLDLEAVSWFYRWLHRYDGTVVMIAHDREVLDRIATEIIHIEQGVARTYKGGYSAFEKQHAAALLEQATLLERQAKERVRIQKFVDRFQAKASKAKQVQSRIKLLEKMTYTAVLRDEAPYRFSIPSPSHFDKPMVTFRACKLGFGEHVVIEEFTKQIYPKDRIGILGVNGAGKTTLLRALALDITPLQGAVEVSDHTSIGYFAQHQLEVLRETSSACAHIEQTSDLPAQSIRNFLGKWGLSGSSIFRPVDQLSGGERARLVLAKLALQQPALLVLDEPTNHLDIEMRVALSRALDNFEGAVVMVAHDQHVLRQCVNEFWLIRERTVSTYEGDIDDYEATLSSSSDAQFHRVKPSAKANRQHRALQRKQKSALERELHRIEQTLDELLVLERLLTEQLADPKALTNLDRTELNDLLVEHNKHVQEIPRLETEWYSISEKLDRFTESGSQ